jgi:hypothetical protein
VVEVVEEGAVVVEVTAGASAPEAHAAATTARARIGTIRMSGT